MVVAYKDKTYDVTGESIYSDFSIIANDISEAVEIIEEFADLETYTFDMTEYTDMTVRRRIIIDDGVNVVAKIQLMKKARG